MRISFHPNALGAHIFLQLIMHWPLNWNLGLHRNAFRMDVFSFYYVFAHIIWGNPIDKSKTNGYLDTLCWLILNAIFYLQTSDVVVKLRQLGTAILEFWRGGHTWAKLSACQFMHMGDIWSGQYRLRAGEILAQLNDPEHYNPVGMKFNAPLQIPAAWTGIHWVL